jgi:hypothetical protein
MIVWGGGFAGTPVNTGGRFDPMGNAWTPTSTGANVPAARVRHTAVWTGTEMIVWGGQVFSGDALATGGHYIPATDTWTPTATAGAPAARYLHSAVWTGNEMIVWGGTDGSAMASGGRYRCVPN